MKTEAKPKYNICIVSDYFYPSYGGVETHIFYLSQCLISLGHKVVILTGNVFTERQGVRYLTNGLKVYYCPFQPTYTKTLTSVMFLTCIAHVRNILIRESIDIVHGNQLSSILALECIEHAKLLGLKVIFTSHSLYNYKTFGSIQLMKLVEFKSINVDYFICVSQTCKENLMLNTKFDPNRIFVIPNGIDSDRFTPDISKSPNVKEKIVVLFMSRLVARKGVDLLIKVVPNICKKYKNTEFIIVGDGPKKIFLEEMIKCNRLHKRVKLENGIPNDKVRDKLVKAHIFLNCSLTESFCIAIIEALSCGLNVVSTDVGGIPEVLPRDMLSLCKPNSHEIEISLSHVISNLVLTPQKNHDLIRSMYNWTDVAKRTEAVYQTAINTEIGTCMKNCKKLIEKSCGFYELFFVILLSINFVIFKFLEWVQPKESIPKAFDFRFLDKINKT